MRAQRILIGGLALAAAFCSCFDLSGTRCGGTYGECGSGYWCRTSDGTCQKGEAPASGDAGLPDASDASHGADGSVPDASLPLSRDAGACDGSCIPGFCAGTDAACSSFRECTNAVCALGCCKVALFSDDFEQEQVRDGGYFSKWGDYQTCNQAYYGECQVAIADVVSFDGGFYQGSHGALFALDNDGGKPPYWSYETERVTPPFGATVVVGMYVKWLGGNTPQDYSNINVFGAWKDKPHEANLVDVLMVSFDTVSRKWLVRSYGPSSVLSVATSSAQLKDDWQHVELEVSPPEYALFVEGVQVARGKGMSFDTVNYVSVGANYGTMTYAFVVDLVSVSEQ